MNGEDAGLTAAAIIVTVELFLLGLFVAIPEVVDWLEEALAPVGRVITWPVERVFWAAEWAFGQLAAAVRRWTG